MRHAHRRAAILSISLHMPTRRIDHLRGLYRRHDDFAIDAFIYHLLRRRGDYFKAHARLPHLARKAQEAALLRFSRQ